MFGFFRKKPPAPKAPLDPLAVFDGVIESLERQAGEVRKSAATLLALRGELTRDVERYSKRMAELASRVETAASQGDAKVERALRRDADEAATLKANSEAALTQAQTDASLLLEAGETLAAKVAELKAERLSAKARVAAGHTITATLTQVEEFDRVLKLDAARDEVERAHALAELYREEAEAKAKTK